MNFMSRVSATGKIATSAPVSQIGGVRLLLLLSGFGMLIALRLPMAWTGGRFVDEEASVFLSYAWNFPAVEAMFRSFAGYWNVAANGFTLLVATSVKAGLLPLAQAPYATMLIGLLFQLAPVFLLLTGQASWLSSRASRMMAAALVVLAPGTEEVYLNVMHIQFHLALCVAIILGLDVPQIRRTRILYAFVLISAPLCGPGAIILLPLFALRAITDRSTGRAWQVALLGAGSAIQMIVFYEANSARGGPTDPIVLLAGMFVRIIIMPLAGPLATGLAGAEVVESAVVGGPLLYFLAFMALLLFGTLAWLCLRCRDAAVWFFAGGLLTCVISLGLGLAARPGNAQEMILSGIASPRYNFLPQILFALCLVVIAQRERSAGPAVARVLLILNLAAGMLFFSMNHQMYANGPSWAAEVRKWEANPDYRLAVWPRRFSADLSGRRYSCPEKTTPRGNPADPRYCESGWLAGFQTGSEAQD